MDDSDNLIFLVVVLAIYEALILICYFFLSTPILTLLNGIVTLFSDSVSQMGTYGIPTLVIFNIMFAIAFIIPIVWFLVKIARVESGYMTRRL